MGRGGIPSGFMSISQAAEVAGVTRATLERAIRSMTLAGHCAGCKHQFNRWELTGEQTHACPRGPSWGRRARVMVKVYAARTFKPDPTKQRVGKLGGRPKGLATGE